MNRTKMRRPRVNWYNIDWRKPTRQIVRETGAFKSTVSTWRRKLAPETLQPNLGKPLMQPEDKNVELMKQVEEDMYEINKHAEELYHARMEAAVVLSRMVQEKLRKKKISFIDRVFFPSIIRRKVDEAVLESLNESVEAARVI